MIDAPEIDSKAVARRMRTQMQARDITIVKLARKLGVIPLRAEELVLGKAVLGPMMVRLIAEGLRCNADYLLTGKVQP